MRTDDPKDSRPPVSGEAFTRRAITAITAWIAWLVGLAVDLSVVGLLAGIRFLSLHSYDDEQLRKPRRLLRLCGLLTLALNTAGALGHQQYGNRQAHLP